MLHGSLLFFCPLTWEPLDDFSLSNFPHPGEPEPETRDHINSQYLPLTVNFRSPAL